jgi:hypothetical protein
VVAGPPAREPLEGQQRQRHRHEQRAELHRRLAVEAEEPDAVDGVGEGGHAEQVDRAEVGECLHQRQGDPAEDRRASHRHGHAQDRRAPRQAEAAGGLHGRARLGEEGAAGQQVDVRIEHEREDADRAKGGAERAPRIEHAQREQGEHVAGHGQGEHQRPLDPGAAREVAERHEQGEGGPEHERAGADPGEQEGRAAQCLGQEPREARERARLSRHERDWQADQGPGYEQCGHERDHGPAVEAGKQPTGPARPQRGLA